MAKARFESELILLPLLGVLWVTGLSVGLLHPYQLLAVGVVDLAVSWTAGFFLKVLMDKSEPITTWGVLVLLFSCSPVILIGGVATYFLTSAVFTVEPNGDYGVRFVDGINSSGLAMVVATLGVYAWSVRAHYLNRVWNRRRSVNLTLFPPVLAWAAAGGVIYFSAWAGAIVLEIARPLAHYLVRFGEGTKSNDSPQNSGWVFLHGPPDSEPPEIKPEFPTSAASKSKVTGTELWEKFDVTGAKEDANESE